MNKANDYRVCLSSCVMCWKAKRIAETTADATPRKEFRVHARSIFAANGQTSSDDARTLLTLYDAIPSPNCLDGLWLRLATHKALKHAANQREKIVVM